MRKAHETGLVFAATPIKFATTHCAKIEGAALVGEKKWEAWMATICKPFTMAKVRYFIAVEIDAAWAWLGEG